MLDTSSASDGTWNERPGPSGSRSPSPYSPIHFGRFHMKDERNFFESGPEASAMPPGSPDSPPPMWLSS